MYIAVDFDGTCVDHRYPEIGKVVPMAIETLKEFMKNGDELFLNTMRSGVELMEAVNWLYDRGVVLSGINENPNQKEWTDSPKVYGHIYIDDAAFGCPLIRPEGFKRPCVDWQKVYNQFFGLKSSQEKAMEK